MRGEIVKSGERLAETGIPADRSGAEWLRAVADPVRLTIIRSLSNVGDASVTELISRGPASSQTLRRHLDSLVAAGVVEECPGQSDGERVGRPATRFSLRPDIRKSVHLYFGP